MFEPRNQGESYLAWLFRTVGSPFGETTFQVVPEEIVALINQFMAGVKSSGRDIATLNPEEVQAELDVFMRESFGPDSDGAGDDPGTGSADDPGQDSVDNVIETIDDTGAIIDQVLDVMLDVVLSGVIDGQNDLPSIITGSVGQIVASINDGNNNSDTLIGGILDTVIGTLADQTGILGDILSFISDAIEVTITNNIIIPDAVFRAVGEALIAVMVEQNRAQFEVLTIFSDTIVRVVDRTIETELETANIIAQAINAQTRSEDTNDEELLAEVVKLADPGDDGTGYNLAKGVGALLGEAVLGSKTGISEAWLKGFSDDVLADCDASTLSAWIDEKGVIDGTAGKLVYEIMQVIGKAMGLIAIGSALGAKELAEFSRCEPWAIMQPGDAIASYQRGLISWEEALLEIRMNGYNEARTNALGESGYQVPDLAALYSMNLRGFPQAENLTERIKNLGFNPNDAEALADLKFYIPPPQDLISMAVRDVFDPERVAAFKQDEDFPPEFAFWSKQQGISEDWAHKYWQAHWVLPSVQMAFEMLHRKVIDEDRLKDLMAAQDIIPGWRDALIAISYSPYTRVDIRRMHKVGVLDEQQVFMAYQDIGYDEDKAQTLTDFTVALNSDDSDDDPEALEGITRSAVITAYKDGTIDEATANDLMKSAGIGEDARSIYLFAANVDIAATDKKDALTAIESQFKLGVMSLPEAINEIRLLPLTEGEISKALLKLTKASADSVKMPSKADLDKMFLADIIDKDEYEQQLERLNYTPTWIKRYIELLALKEKPDATAA